MAFDIPNMSEVLLAKASEEGSWPEGSPATKDGGPAFPRSDGGYSPTQDGMSLRDWFAGQALIGLLAHASGEAPSNALKEAFKLADAMLAARAA